MIELINILEEYNKTIIPAPNNYKSSVKKPLIIKKNEEDLLEYGINHGLFKVKDYNYNKKLLICPDKTIFLLTPKTEYKLEKFINYRKKKLCTEKSSNTVQKNKEQ